MFTKIIQMCLRGISAALAGTVAAAIFGPTLAANASAYFRQPPVQIVARKPLPESQKREREFTKHVGHGQQTAVGAQAPHITPAGVLPKPTLPFSTPSTSSVSITPVMEATATPGVSPTAAAIDSAPVVDVPDSPVAVATSDAPAPTHTAPSVPSVTPSPVKTTTAPKPSPTATHTATATPKPTATAPSASVIRAGKVAAVLAFARAQLGERYVMGGMGPNTWDCSGLSKMAFSVIGINIGTHSSNNQYQTAKSRGQLVPFSQKRAGDLVFYGTPGNIYHVAIYSGNGRIIEAANPSRPVLERAYWGTPYSYVARPIK